MRSLLPVAATAAMLLASCGGQSAPSPAPTAETNAYAQKVAALTETQRDAVLLRAIRDADQPCQGVSKSVASDRSKPAAAWIATCDDGAQWVVAIGNNGGATVAGARDFATQNPAGKVSPEEGNDMGMFDGILGQLAGQVDLEGIAARAGLPPEQVAQVVQALGISHAEPGDTVEGAAEKTGVAPDTVQQVLAHLGGEGALGKLGGLLGGAEGGGGLAGGLSGLGSMFGKS